jgi:hypothetical protein
MLLTPDETVCHSTTEGRERPILLCPLSHRHHVNMTNEQGRCQAGVTAAPRQQVREATAAQLLNFQVLPDLQLQVQ